MALTRVTKWVLATGLASFLPVGAYAQLNNDNSPWEMFAARLAQRLSVPANGEAPTFQIIREPKLANWADPKYGIGDLFTLAGYLTEPGEFYSPSSNLTLFGQYTAFLSSLDLPASNESLKPAMKKARSEWVAALGGFNKLYDERGKAWERFVKTEAALPQNERTPYQIWYEREYGPKLGAQQGVVDEKALAYADLLGGSYKGFQRIGSLVANLDSKANLQVATFPVGPPLEVPKFSVDTDMAEFIKKGDEGKGFSETWEFDKSHSRRALSWSNRGGSAGVRIGWFRFGGGGGGKKETLDITKDGVSMTVTFKNFTTATIIPGSWYNGDAIKLLWDSPYTPGAVASKEKLFGPNGSFKPRVSRAVLVYKPSIVLKLDSAASAKVLESWNGSGSVGIGPFQFRGGAAGGKDELVEDKARNALIIEDKTGIPQIVAVFVVNYPQ